MFAHRRVPTFLLLLFLPPSAPPVGSVLHQTELCDVFLSPESNTTTVLEGRTWSFHLAVLDPVLQRDPVKPNRLSCFPRRIAASTHDYTCSLLVRPCQEKSTGLLPAAWATLPRPLALQVSAPAPALAPRPCLNPTPGAGDMHRQTEAGKVSG